MRSLAVKPCVVCGSRDREPVVALGADWRVARCEDCGMHVLAPEPSEVRMEEFEEGSGYDDAFALREDIMARYDRSLAGVERFVEPGRILDVGCGGGFLLEAARTRGWHAVGVDPSAFSVERARAAGFEAHRGMLEDLDLPRGGFDAVALLQVVEHMPDARPLLAACRPLLRPGGAILVSTPNPDSLLARVKREGFNYWIPPVHCVWYTPEALERLLRQTGFSPARQVTWSARSPRLHDGYDVVVATRPGRRLPYRAQRWAGELVARAADLLGYGTMTEQVAIRWE